MYRKVKMRETQLSVNTGYIGESIEEKVARILNNSEPITDGAPLIFTERKAGVQPSYNIRTDRFEVAVDAMEGVAKSYIAKREERGKLVDMKPKEDGGAEPIQGTENN